MGSGMGGGMGGAVGGVKRGDAWHAWDAWDGGRGRRWGVTSVTAAFGGVEVPEEDPRGVLNRLLFLPRSLIGCWGASLAVRARVMWETLRHLFELEDTRNAGMAGVPNGRKIR